MLHLLTFLVALVTITAMGTDIVESTQDTATTTTTTAPQQITAPDYPIIGIVHAKS